MRVLSRPGAACSYRAPARRVSSYASCWPCPFAGGVDKVRCKSAPSRVITIRKPVGGRCEPCRERSARRCFTRWVVLDEVNDPDPKDASQSAVDQVAAPAGKRLGSSPHAHHVVDVVHMLHVYIARSALAVSRVTVPTKEDLQRFDGSRHVLASFLSALRAFLPHGER
jgi:hypothetical protein